MAGPEGDLVVIARLGRAHGVEGAVRATATGPTLATLRPGDEVHVARRDGAPRAHRVVSCHGAPSAILRLEGVVSRDAAAALTNSELLVAAARLPPAGDPDTFYVRELVGFTVLEHGHPVGPVTGVAPAPANDALEVAGPEGEVLIPFTADAVIAVDRSARTVTVRPGLLPPSWRPPSP